MVAAAAGRPATAAASPPGTATPRPITRPPTPVPSDAVLEAARTIQNVCFALYPPELLKTMTGSATPPPQDVSADPARQMKYLTAEKKEEKGLFYPSSLEDILPGLMSEVREGRSFLDLGSGDGRVVFMAAILGAQATGIEYEPEMHQIAETALRKLRATVPKERVTLLKGDFYKLDWSRYDVLFYFGLGTFDESGMLAKMRREMRPEAILILAHRQPPSAGFLPIARYGVVSTWRIDPDDPLEDEAPPAPHPKKPR